MRRGVPFSRAISPHTGIQYHSYACPRMLNIPQRWTGTHFASTSLKDLGAVFHLGHAYNSLCSIPSSPISLTVFDVTGVHMISITYCECDPNESSIPPFIQLFRVQWFPATWRRPGTAFMFRLLNFLHTLHTGCKVNLYDFHATVTATSDNAGLGKRVVSACLKSTCVTNLFSHSSGTTSCVWCSNYMCSSANSDEAGVAFSWVEYLPFQRGGWSSIVQHAHTPAGTLTCQKNKC